MSIIKSSNIHACYICNQEIPRGDYRRREKGKHYHLECTRTKKKALGDRLMDYIYSWIGNHGE